MSDFRPLPKAKYLPYSVEVIGLDGNSDEKFLAVDDGPEGESRIFKKVEGGLVQYPSGRYIFKISEKIVDPEWLESIKAPIFFPDFKEDQHPKKDDSRVIIAGLITIPLIIAFILGFII